MKNNAKSKQFLKITSGVKAGRRHCTEDQNDVDNVAKSCCSGNKYACGQYKAALAPRGCTSKYASCKEIQG